MSSESRKTLLTRVLKGEDMNKIDLAADDLFAKEGADDDVF